MVWTKMYLEKPENLSSFWNVEGEAAI